MATEYKYVFRNGALVKTTLDGATMSTSNWTYSIPQLHSNPLHKPPRKLSSSEEPFQVPLVIENHTVPEKTLSIISKPGSDSNEHIKGCHAPAKTTAFDTNSATQSQMTSTDNHPVTGPYISASNEQRDAQNNPQSPTNTAQYKNDLAQRDREAVKYTKSLLVNGDTLVFINYPSSIFCYDVTGFPIQDETHQVKSKNLLGTGSSVFADLLAPTKQFRILRRKKLVGKLPTGIKYVLDLTPPEEGDEAVELTSELSCSLGTRLWYTAETRCKISHDLVGGKDFILSPRKGLFLKEGKENNDLVDQMEHQQSTYDSGDSTNLSHTQGRTTAAEDDDTNLQNALLRSRGEDFNLQEAIRRSKLEASTRATKPIEIQEVPEYCPVRHRAGISQLLRLIEGKGSRPDSAPKVWTLLALAKYFDCTRVVEDYIVTWMIVDPNSRFIETLPEVSCNIGFGLKNPLITRAAFSILVSEEALSLASRSRGDFSASTRGTNQFGRIRENVIDEDLRTRIEYASKSFADKILAVMNNLVEAQMTWFEEIDDYKKLRRFEEAITLNCSDAQKTATLLSYIDKLKDILRNFVRGRILWALTADLTLEDAEIAFKHRLEEQWKPSTRTQEMISFHEKYNSLSSEERIITRFSWGALKRVNFNTSCPTNLLFDASILSDSYEIDLARRYGVRVIFLDDLLEAHKQVNGAIVSAVLDGFYGEGVLPPEAISHPGTNHQAVRSRRSEPAKLQPWTAYEEDVPTSGTNFDGLETKTGLTYGTQQPGNGKTMVEQPKDGSSPYFAREADRLLIKRGAIPPTVDSYQGLEQQLPIRNLRSGSRQERQQCLSDIVAGKISTVHEKTWQDNKARNSTKTAASTDYTGKSSISFPDISTPSQTQGDALPVGDPMIRPAVRNMMPRPSPDSAIGNYPLFFDLVVFLKEVAHHIHTVCAQMLDTREMAIEVSLTDTLLCLGQNELKYLPLWAGGDDDGSGGVFDEVIPVATAGPSGPGPSFHTGFSDRSTASSEFSFAGMTNRTSVDTSVAVEDGFSDHIDRRRVFAEDEIDFHSETFSDDVYNYDTKGKGVTRGHDFGHQAAISFDSSTLAEEDETSFDRMSDTATETGADAGDDSDTNVIDSVKADTSTEDDAWDDDMESFDFGDSDEEM